MLGAIDLFFERGDEKKVMRCKRGRGTEQEARHRMQLPYLLDSALRGATNHNADTKNTSCSVMT